MSLTTDLPFSTDIKERVDLHLHLCLLDMLQGERFVYNKWRW